MVENHVTSSEIKEPTSMIELTDVWGKPEYALQY